MKIFGVFSLLIVFLFLFVWTANAADFSPPDTEQILGPIPAPIKSFVDSIKQIGGVQEKNTSVNFNFSPQVPGRIYDRIDSWFFNATGLRLSSVIKGIGNVIVWFLALIVELFKWLLSFIK